MVQEKQMSTLANDQVAGCCILKQSGRGQMCRRKSFGTDLADTFPGNDVFGIAAEKTADLCRTGINDCFHKSGTDIDIHIAYTAKRTAGTGVDHFFLPQFTDSHKIPTPSFEIERTDRCTQDSRCFRKVFFL